MPNWIEPTENDLAASVSQGEIDAYRRDSSPDGSDPVASLLARTAALVRTWIASGGRCAKMGPAGTLPVGLVIPAMDYAMGKLLVRINVPLSEDRRNALRRAEELFDEIAKGKVSVEGYVEDADPDAETVATSPTYTKPRPERLLD